MLNVLNAKAISNNNDKSMTEECKNNGLPIFSLVNFIPLPFLQCAYRHCVIFCIRVRGCSTKNGHIESYCKDSSRQSINQWGVQEVKTPPEISERN